MRNFFGDVRGSAVVIFALAGPALAIGVGAAVEYASLSSRHSKLQGAVDAAALAATQQLRLSNNTDEIVSGTARAVVAEKAPTPQGTVTRVAVEVLNKRAAARVTAEETVRSWMGRLLSAPTMEIRVTAQAQLSGTAKLCLLTLDTTKGKVMHLDKSSLITATGCAVYSNSNDKAGLTAEDGARATASLICSVGGVESRNAILSPTPTTDCPAMGDPLATQKRPNVGVCRAFSMKVTKAQTIYPGTYCQGIEVSGSGVLTMMPGIYVMNDGPLIVSGKAVLAGQNVGIYFVGNQGGMRLDPDTSVSLTAPRDGDMAGLLFFEDRSVSAWFNLPVGPLGAIVPPPAGSQPMREYRISSNNAPMLLGTIYLPAGRLVIDASRPVAERSAFTVIVARQLELNSGPNLVLNSDYAGTDVPVPEGVGPNSGTMSLTR